MSSIRRSVEIEASAGEVFKFLTKPENLPVVWPSMVEVSDVKRRPDGWHTFNWVYKMAGVRFHGHSDTVEAKQDSLLVMKQDKGIKSTFRWTFEPKGDGMLLTLDVEYEIPGALGKLAKPFLLKLNEREAETLLANMKLRLEEKKEARIEPQPHA